MKKSKKMLAWLLSLTVAVTMCFGSVGAAFAEGGDASEPQVVLKVNDTDFYMDTSGDGEYFLYTASGDATGSAIPNIEPCDYSAINNYGTIEKAEAMTADKPYGPTVISILEAAEIDTSGDALSGKALKFSDGTGYSTTLDYDAIFKTERYSFASLLGKDKQIDYGEPVTSSEEGTPVEAIINLAYTDKKGNTQLIYGQETLTDRTKPGFVKGVAAYTKGKDKKTGTEIEGPGSISVVDKKIKQYINPITVDTFVAANSDFSLNYSTDKDTGVSGNIYYTLDGSEPSMKSAIYNYNSKENIVKPIKMGNAGKYTLKLKVMGVTGLPSETVSYDIVAVSPKLAKKTYIYDGKKKKPTVKISGLKNGTDYTVTYSENKKVGIATAAIAGKGTLKGTIKCNYTIKPNKVKITRIKAGKKGTRKITVNVKSLKKSGITGYEIKYSSASDKKIVKKGSAKKLVVKKLKKGKCKVKVRAYKTVGSETIYGSWSKVKSVKVK